MAKVELKQPVVQEISELITDAKSVVLVDYRGITVDDDTKLRKELRENGVSYKVFKNTLVKLAVKDTAFEALSKDLEGPTALAVSKTDPTTPARIVSDYCKKINAISMKAGVVDGTYYDNKGIYVIASIPGREVLLSKFMGSIQSPIANFARVIKQIAEKKAEGGAAPAPATEAAPTEA
ncbi:MAG: 50S ribosomal protein L10 [Lachnospiraceae bacterium]|nr:50S ribosomal protein L10 [Lachnospiraceae bacterium]